MPESTPTTYFWLGLVILVSLFLGFYELFRTFGRDFGRCLGRRYALLLMVLNVGTALVVWWVVHGPLAVQPTFLSTVLTGLTFPDPAAQPLHSVPLHHARPDRRDERTVTQDGRDLSLPPGRPGR